MQVKLAEALLRRKELEGKVAVLKQIQDKNLFEVRAQRKNVTDNIDDIVAMVPKLTASQSRGMISSAATICAPLMPERAVAKASSRSASGTPPQAAVIFDSE